MASFRNGFKIFGELLLKEGLGRTRSFSEDRKPRQWLPEDQWAVRCPGSTCPPCDKPKKPAKPSKSWLSICKDPEVPIECDIRHNNCPPPPVKEEGPWYSLDNLIPKKKQEKPPPICSCREEIRRKEMMREEELEVCENLESKISEPPVKTEQSDDCSSKQEPCPAPVISLSAPLPKEIDIMLWCGQPSKDTCRVAAKCQSDRLPFQEFRPQKCWKPPPFSLPKADSIPLQSSSCRNTYVAFSEFKYVEVPKPLYSRYKSVELKNSNSLFSMTNASCPDNDPLPCTALTPHPNPIPLPLGECVKDSENESEKYIEKPLIQSASCKPVRLKNAPKYTYRQKITKLIERRVYKNPCAQHKKCNLSFSPQDASEDIEINQVKNQNTDNEPPKVITGCLTDEPQTYERNYNNPNTPPKWMYNLTKPGMKTTPLVPCFLDYPKEPDWRSETDGLNFYDGNNDGIRPKPKPDPYKEALVTKSKPVPPNSQLPDPPEIKPKKEKVQKNKNRFVLMPENFNIKRGEDPIVDVSKANFEKFVEAKAISKNPIKPYQPIKENILYDLQRMTSNLPFDPSKLNSSCRKPSSPPCPQPPEFYRSYSTFTPSTLKNLCSAQLNVTQRRTDCGDSRDKCRVRPLIPKPRECPEKTGGADCAEIILPCCPKANIPPTCNQKTTLPPCKKKCAPKPSFSECNRDLPPCPKPTECNCWEKKPWQKKY